SKRMNEAALKMPGIEYTLVGAGASNKSNEGSVYIKMKDLDERDISQNELVLRLRQEVMPQFDGLGLRSIVSGTSGFGGAGRAGATIQYVMSGPDLQKLSEASQKAL